MWIAFILVAMIIVTATAVKIAPVRGPAWLGLLALAVATAFFVGAVFIGDDGLLFQRLIKADLMLAGLGHLFVAAFLVALAKGNWTATTHTTT